MSSLHPRSPFRAILQAALGVTIAASCASPSVVSPTPAGQSQGPVTSPPVSGSTIPTSPSGSAATPQPLGSHAAGDPCRLVTLDEVNAALGAGYQPPARQGVACIFPADATAGNGSLVSVAVTSSDVLTPIRSRYTDLKPVSVDAGTAAWSASVNTLWLVVAGRSTVMVSIPGKDLPEDQLQAAALLLAKLAAGRI